MNGFFIHVLSKSIINEVICGGDELRLHHSDHNHSAALTGNVDFGDTWVTASSYAQREKYINALKSFF